jgi:hypothetical protein
VFSHRFFSVIGDSREGVRTKSKMNKMIAYCALIFQFESKNFKNANNDTLDFFQLKAGGIGINLAAASNAFLMV